MSFVRTWPAGSLTALAVVLLLLQGFTNTSGIPDGTYGVIIGLLTSVIRTTTLERLSLELTPSGTTTTGVLVSAVNITQRHIVGVD